MKLRNSTYLALAIICHLLLLAVAGLHASIRHAAAWSERAGNRLLVRSLQLTDLCLFTEARYTRHPTMADRHAAFQEYPSAMDHFPSGSLLPPPGQMVSRDAQVH